MSGAQPLAAPVGLLPLPRPLMIGEVLDAAFRLFRGGLLRTLPYSGLVVLMLELPTLYTDFIFPGRRDPVLEIFGYAAVLLLSTALLGVITLRLHAVSRGEKPRFRTEIATVLWRWPAALLATLGALGFPLALFVLSPAIVNVLPTEALSVLALPLLWPTALFLVTLPAFWCDRLGPLSAIAQALRISRRRSWRMVGAILAIICMLAVFYLLSIMVAGLVSSILRRADLFLFATVRSMLTLVVGAFGVPFVLAVLIIAHEDLKLRRGAAR